MKLVYIKNSFILLAGTRVYQYDNMAAFVSLHELLSCLAIENENFCEVLNPRFLGFRPDSEIIAECKTVKELLELYSEELI